jgi:hypothetical protein
MNRQQQIAVLEKNLAQARKNLKLFKCDDPDTLAGLSLNPLATKLMSEVAAYQLTIKELKDRSG